MIRSDASLNMPIRSSLAFILLKKKLFRSLIIRDEFIVFIDILFYLTS